MLDRFKATLRSSGHSYTAARQTVFEQLAKQGPLAISQLAGKCEPKVDRATVYRTIDLFERLGIINRIWHGFKSQVELSEIFTPHHHHAVCQRCHTSIEIVNPELEKLLAATAKRYNFLNISHVIELSGYCEECQQNN